MLIQTPNIITATSALTLTLRGSLVLLLVWLILYMCTNMNLPLNNNTTLLSNLLTISSDHSNPFIPQVHSGQCSRRSSWLSRYLMGSSHLMAHPILSFILGSWLIIFQTIITPVNSIASLFFLIVSYLFCFVYVLGILFICIIIRCDAS